MIVRSGHRKYSVYAFDVESHNDTISVAMRQTSVWLYSLINEDSEPNDPDNFGTSMHAFLERIHYLAQWRSKKKRNILIYDFNLSFEWSFLLPVLLAHGFTFKEKIEDDDEMVFNSITTKTASSVWLVNLKFHKKDGMIAIRDLGKIFSGSLRSMAESFGLETQKGDMDYTLDRRRKDGHLIEWTPTPEEISYNFKDTRILIDILLAMQKRDDKDFWNSVSAASYSMRKMMKVGYPKCYRVMRKYRSQNQYPNLEKDETEFLRKTAEGGICYAAADYQFKDINERINHIDAHSMHPSSAYLNFFPYGKGEHYEGEWNGSFRICACHIRISYDYVRLYENIKLIGTPVATDYEIWVWSFEIPTMKKCYGNLKIEYVDGYAYHARKLPWRMYYYDKYRLRAIAKANHDAFGKAYNKLLINASYGKMLENPHNITFQNIVDEDGIINSLELPREKVSLEGKYTYVPVGSTIPAYSRVRLIETALRIGWKNVCYFDTDSIFFIDNEETRKALKSINFKDELGGWSMEEPIKRAQFACPKRYKLELETTDDNGNNLVDVKMAGVNFKQEAPTFETNIVSGDFSIQRAERVRGGTIIVFQGKHIDVQPKYVPLYEANMVQ